MAECGEFEISDGVAILTLSAPPGNALTPAVRLWLSDRVSDAEAAPDVFALLLLGAGGSFSTGLDLAEYDGPLAAPHIADLCMQLEQCRKPVVAGLEGAVLGAGLELALAAHYRVAAPSAQIGFPEVALGLVPCGGGTQRATRILGPDVVLDMLLDGQPRLANDPALQPMLDLTAEGPARAAGLRLAHRLVSAQLPVRPARNRDEGLRDFIGFRDTVDRRRAEYEDGPDTAPKEIIDCVEAASLLSYDAAMTFEQAAFDTCLASPESFALRQAAHAERSVIQAARRFQGPFDVTRVVVIGPGTLAAQLVVSLLAAGLHVSWGVPDTGLMPDCLSRLNLILAAVADEGLIALDAKERLRARCHLGLTEEVADEGRLILIAARGQPEFDADPSVPQLVCAPARVEGVGLRFSTPVPRGRLAEVIQGPRATRQQMEAAFRLCERLGKMPVRMKSTGLAISDRIAAACHRAADGLVDAGLSPYEVDAAMLSWGWGWPPFQLRDLVGLESTVGLVRAEGAENWSALMVAAGRKGRAFGQGFYRYDEDGTARISREVMDIINARRAPTKDITKRTIQLLMIGAMANEGARTLADGWARCPSDIDLVCLNTLNFPRTRGGPMTAADLAGLFNLTRAMRSFEHPDKPFWTPHELLYDLIKNGKTFSSMLA